MEERATPVQRQTDKRQPYAPDQPGSRSSMTIRYSQSSSQFARLLAGRWTLAVLGQLVDGGRRYQDLYDALDGISYKMLTDTLRRAERDGLIVRHLDGGRIETATLYELTDLGGSLDVPLAAMTEWADANWQTVEAARRHWGRLRRESP
jgi:DNA-binding HxlR family transcriptional regulator